MCVESLYKPNTRQNVAKCENTVQICRESDSNLNESKSGFEDLSSSHCYAPALIDLINASVAVWSPFKYTRWCPCSHSPGSSNRASAVLSFTWNPFFNRKANRVGGLEPKQKAWNSSHLLPEAVVFQNGSAAHYSSEAGRKKKFGLWSLREASDGWSRKFASSVFEPLIPVLRGSAGLQATLISIPSTWSHAHGKRLG